MIFTVKLKPLIQIQTQLTPGKVAPIQPLKLFVDMFAVLIQMEHKFAVTFAEKNLLLIMELTRFIILYKQVIKTLRLI